MGSATASTSLARRSATSCGRLRGAAQAVRQGAPNRQFGVLSHDADDVVGDPQLGCGQLGAVDLARQLVRHLGTGRGGRLRQQTRNVGLRKG